MSMRVSRAGRVEGAANERTGAAAELDDGSFAADGAAGAERDERRERLQQHRRQADSAAAEHDRLEDDRDAAAAGRADGEQADGGRRGASRGRQREAPIPTQRREALQDVGNAEEERDAVVQHEPEGDGEARRPAFPPAGPTPCSAPFSSF